MVEQSLIEYINKSLTQGQGKEQITEALLANGWTREVIEEAFTEIENRQKDIPQPPEEKQIEEKKLSGQDLPFSQLQKEVTKWKKEGIVTKEQAEDILLRSGPKAKEQEAAKRRSKIIIIISILGSILLGLGMILLIASNWELIPKGIKVLLILTAVSGAYFAGYWLKFEKKNYPRVGTSLLLLGSLFFGAGIILIAQIFNIKAESGNTLLYWALLILPLAWVARSKLVLALSSTLLIVWNWFKVLSFGFLPFFERGLWHEPSVNYTYIILALAILIPLTYLIRSSKVQALNIIGISIWLGQAAAISWLEEIRDTIIPLIVLYLVFGIFIYLLGKLHFQIEKIKNYKGAYYILGLVFVLFPSYLLTFKDIVEETSYGIGEAAQFLIVYFLLIILSLVVAGLCFYYRKVKSTIDTWEVVALTFLLFLSTAVLFAPSEYYAVLFNIILLVEILGIIYLAFYKREKAFINLGLLFFVLLVITRYFDMAWKLLPRSFFFIFGGIILIVGSIFLERLRRKFIKKMISP